MSNSCLLLIAKDAVYCSNISVLCYITVTEDAYFALKNLKGVNESFSDTILRVSGKHSLKDFVGILSEESGERIENIFVNGV